MHQESGKLAAGSAAEVSLVVQVSDLAKALAISTEDDFPEVFATSRMIALMELAAARCMKTVLQPGDLSVGVGVNIMHLAATPAGVKVTARAVFNEHNGKLYCFTLEAFDEAGLIGKGQHTRAVISTERLLSGAQTRMADAGHTRVK